MAMSDVMYSPRASRADYHSPDGPRERIRAVEKKAMTATLELRRGPVPPVRISMGITDTELLKELSAEIQKTTEILHAHATSMRTLQEEFSKKAVVDRTATSSVRDLELVSYGRSILYMTGCALISAFSFGLAVRFYEQARYFYIAPATLAALIVGAVATANFDSLLKVYRELKKSTATDT